MFGTLKRQDRQDGSVGWGSDRKARCNTDDLCLISQWQCDEGFYSLNQLSVQTLLQCLYNTPVQCTLKILNTGTTVWIQKYSTHLQEWSGDWTFPQLILTESPSTNHIKLKLDQIIISWNIQLTFLITVLMMLWPSNVVMVTGNGSGLTR